MRHILNKDFTLIKLYNILNYIIEIKFKKTVPLRGHYDGIWTRVVQLLRE